jgi:hypothetical protein
MASRRDQENWQEDRLMIFLTATATKGAQRNKGPGRWNPGCRSRTLPFPILQALASFSISCQPSINPEPAKIVEVAVTAGHTILMLR